MERTHPPTRWIVTGGSGFLGTNFLASSRKEDGDIIVISRRLPRWPVLSPWISYIEQDVREVDAYRHLLIPGSVVVHLASSSYPGKAEKSIESDIQDGIGGTVRLAQACADQGVRSFIYLSSGGAIYGDQVTSPIREDANPRPISAYGAMKLSVETYLRMIHHVRGLPTVILRVGNVFGKWHAGTGQGAVNVFLARMMRKEQIDIWGDGRQIRDYISADDVSRAIRLAGLANVSGAEVFNVGTGEGTSLIDILKKLADVVGYEARVCFHPPRSVDVLSNILSSEKIQSAFGWHAQDDMDASLQQLWAWMKQNYAP